MFVFALCCTVTNQCVVTAQWISKLILYLVSCIVFDGFGSLCVGQDRTLTNQCVVTSSSTGFASYLLAKSAFACCPVLPRIVC